jgi:hypothetical protein
MVDTVPVQSNNDISITALEHLCIQLLACIAVLLYDTSPLITSIRWSRTMPTVRKLTHEEVQTIDNKGKGLRKRTEEQYDQFLAEYEAGDYGEAELDEDEKRLTVRNRLKAAADRRGLGLQFNRTTGNIIRFKVVSGNGQVDGQPVVQEPEPKPIALDMPPPAKRRGGRPKKVSV